MLSTAQAARMLNITPRRVVALIQSGDIDAERLGKSWAVSEASVVARSQAPRLKGRPPMGIKDASRVESYTLMCADHEVARFCYDRRTHVVGSVRELDDRLWTPFGACGANGRINQYNLNGWIARRYIPATREGLTALLESTGCKNAADLMFCSMGLNLSDQYWFRPEGVSVTWGNVNYFDNAYCDCASRTASDTGEETPSFVAYGPGTSTNGQLKKWWERRHGINYLIKGSSFYSHEPYAEALASELCERLFANGAFVPYAIETVEDEAHSVCPCFVDALTEFVPMVDLECRFGSGYPRTRYDAYLDLLASQGISDARALIDRMIICDYLTANADRHEGNLGIVLDRESRAFLKVAPVFGNGRAFYFGTRRREDLANGLLRYVSNPFEEKPGAQLALVKDYGWFDATRLDGFSDRVEEVLSQNPDLPSWFAVAARLQFERRLAHVVEIAHDLGFSC